ncbi:MAG TPA: ABC transporter ATP-binding protein [Kiritimatiellia bacterium]|jgi:ABC-type oligopeptide transport system ATPase subunit|nr:MAG: Oligopeptide transport ATP-binding protein OppF [Verrucomicrobia bacterium ADurb.Bin018]HOD99598.1 ABC transporter ATP-binding protein [Kiritimatiellia bacterium]HOE36514.1 ABC transporter ATP-binding protein [Kiritimatiellia bacterium]HOR73583.1 ABC transporter ATP-binding protein [Kiritimatiellia bacterium]HOU58054.1 ABC transporter ATP-binding protein [Kiritimatiellia bacterium]
MSTPLLTVDNLRVTYRVGRRRVAAVKGVSFSVARGQCLGIVGESGSGKSSLARAILALEPAATGQVIFAGEDVLKMSRAARQVFRRRAQMVFQDPLGSLNPRLKIGAALAEVLRVHGLARNRREAAAQTAAWLATVGLDAEYATRFPHELSGGQRQRVNLARALCVGAEFLVADEPVSALDVSVQAQILNLLKTLQTERGITWVLIGHDLAVMRHMADELVVMQAGEVVEHGRAVDILASPQHPYTRELVAAVPDVDRALQCRA